jgi:hypothetical protein
MSGQGDVLHRHEAETGGGGGQEGEDDRVRHS